MFQLQLFFPFHCNEWDRVVALPRHKFVTGATLLQLPGIVRRVFGNSEQARYFERFHWSILNFWTLQTAEASSVTHG